MSDLRRGSFIFQPQFFPFEQSSPPDFPPHPSELGKHLQGPCAFGMDLGAVLEESKVSSHFLSLNPFFPAKSKQFPTILRKKKV